MSTDAAFAYGTVFGSDSIPSKTPFLALTTTGGLSWDTILLPLRQLQVIQQVSEVSRDTILLYGLGAAEYAYSLDRGRTWSADSVQTDSTFLIGICRHLSLLNDGRPVALWEGGSAPAPDVGIFIGDWSTAKVEVYEYYIRSTLFYPNPASTVLNVQSVVPGSSISIRDVLGRDVAHSHLDGAARAQLDVSGLPGGFYYLTMTTGRLNLPIGKVAVFAR
jgi:hypothetical protein